MSVLIGNLDVNLSNKTFGLKLIFVWIDLIVEGVDIGLSLAMDERKTVALVGTSIGGLCGKPEFGLMFPAGFERPQQLIWITKYVNSGYTNGILIFQSWCSG